MADVGDTITEGIEDKLRGEYLNGLADDIAAAFDRRLRQVEAKNKAHYQLQQANKG